MKILNLFKKKKEPVYTTEFVPGIENEDDFITDEIRCFKDGEYTHSVKVLCFPESIIKKLDKIQNHK